MVVVYEGVSTEAVTGQLRSLTCAAKQLVTASAYSSCAGLPKLVGNTSPLQARLAQ